MFLSVQTKLPRLLLIAILSLFSYTFSFAQENCTNGIDDDADGLIDLNDPQCACTGIAGGSSSTTPSSLIPNPSFESSNCCPSSWSELNCADTWIQASDATSDYLNNCGFISGSISNAPGLLPLPDGDGVVGAFALQDYMEYVGACLPTAMVAGTSYTIEMSVATTAADGFLDYCGPLPAYSPMTLAIYGANCSDLPFSGSLCPPAPWTILGSVTYTPVTAWNVIPITFTPSTNISGIIIGNACPLPGDYPFNGGALCGVYLLYDNLVLNTSSSFSSTVTANTSGTFGNNLAVNGSADTTGGTWQWYFNGVAIPGATDSTMAFNNIPCGSPISGTYTAMYTIDTMCATASTVIAIPDPPVADFTYTTNCTDAIVNFTNTSVAGTVAPTGFSWQFGDNQNGAVASPSHDYTNAGSYNATFIVSDPNGCADTVTKAVNIYADYANTQSQSICQGDSILFLGQYRNATGVYTQTFPTGGVCDSIVTLNLTVNPTYLTDYADSICEGQTFTIGHYTFNTDGRYVLDLNTVNGCDSTINLDLTVVLLPTAAFFYTPEYVTMDNSHVYFTDASSFSTSVFYTFGSGQTSNQPNPDFDFGGLGTYTVMQVATNSLGCSDSVYVDITVNPTPNYFIPNTFTPDNDGINDQWEVVMTYIRDYQLRVFDRWGELVYFSDDLYKFWNGGKNNSESILKQDIYVYKIVITDYNGREKNFTGNINLIR